MINEDLIQDSIRIIKHSESLALKMQSFGYHLAFSGGKDSQTIYQLCKMAGVKFKPYFYKTSVDPIELLKFIRVNYPDVEWIHPEETMFQIIERHGLPTRRMRICCNILKERQGINAVVITGVRRSESVKRLHHQEIVHQCIKGQDKIMVSPILEWTENDVWDFLKMNNIESCELYKTQHRIGCIGCPMIPKNQKANFETEYPKHAKAYKGAIKKRMGKIFKNGRSPFSYFKDEEETFKWWLSDLSVKNFLEQKTN